MADPPILKARPRRRFDLERSDIELLLGKEPSYRAVQVFSGLYERLVEPDELTELPRSLRARLASTNELLPGLVEVRRLSADSGETIKSLFRLVDGAFIETVLMFSPERATVCVSSQVGCAMACSFCATGDLGFTRQLSAGEILEQTAHASRAAREHGRRLDHVVFMGMGEPLANYQAVLKAAHRIVGELGIGARRITISTVGFVPGIERLANEPLQVNLAVSLHAANDELRDQLVPMNRRYSIQRLMAACERYLDATHRRISFEWALMNGVNDRERDAIELAGLCEQLNAHVNLIPWNPTTGGALRGLSGSSPAQARRFRDVLRKLGVNVTVRRTRGREIDAACGQLAGTISLASPTARDTTDHLGRQGLARPL